MRSSKWLMAVLVLSVAVNLMLGGFVVGRYYLHEARTALLDPALGVFPVMRQLPDERRAELRPLLRQHFRPLRTHLRRMREVQHRIAEALNREPFEPEVLSQALAEFRQALLETQRASHEAMVALTGAMTAQERRLLEQAMARRGPPPHHSARD